MCSRRKSAGCCSTAIPQVLRCVTRWCTAGRFRRPPTAERRQWARGLSCGSHGRCATRIFRMRRCRRSCGAAIRSAFNAWSTESSRAGKTASGDAILKCAQAVDGDADEIAVCERELVAGDDAGASHEIRAVRKAAIAEEPTRKFLRVTLQLGKRRVSFECGPAAAHDLNLDRGNLWQRFVAEQDTGAKPATPVVDLGLRKVEWILALDVARAHVIADGVADDLAARIEQQRQFGLGDRPSCVGADANIRAGTDHTTCCRLEEELRTNGGVDAIVEAATTSVPGLLHARAAAAKVGNPRSPYLLRANRREELVRIGRGDWRRLKAFLCQ